MTVLADADQSWISTNKDVAAVAGESGQLLFLGLAALPLSCLP